MLFATLFSNVFCTSNQQKDSVQVKGGSGAANASLQLRNIGHPESSMDGLSTVLTMSLTGDRAAAAGVAYEWQLVITEIDTGKQLGIQQLDIEDAIERSSSKFKISVSNDSFFCRCVIQVVALNRDGGSSLCGSKWATTDNGESWKPAENNKSL